jgi:hypothetical protein
VQLASILLDMGSPAASPDPLRSIPSAGSERECSSGGGPASVLQSASQALSLPQEEHQTPLPQQRAVGENAWPSSVTVNWKEGVVVDAAAGTRRKLSADELEAMRRERARVHARMTRERKKNLVFGLEQQVHSLEAKVRDQRRDLAWALVEAFPAETTLALFQRLGFTPALARAALAATQAATHSVGLPSHGS